MGHIYFIKRVGCGRYVKIGYTTSIQKRLHTLQTASPEPLEILGAAPGTMKQERHIHEVLGKHHERGEWFRLCAQMMQFIDNAVKFGIDAALEPIRLDNLKRDWEANPRARDHKIKRVRVGKLKTRTVVEYNKQPPA